MRLILLLLFMFCSFVVFAQDSGATYKDAAGTSQLIADSFGDLWSYLFDDVPNMMERFFAWAIIWFVKAKIYFQLEAIKFAWGVAKIIIADLNIMSQITAQMSALPQDVRQALVDIRLFDALNLIFQAYVTKFVMGFFS